MMMRRRNSYKILVGKSESKRSRQRLKLRWEDNIKMDLKEIGWEVVEWILVDQNRDHWQALVKTVVKLWVP